MEVMLWQRLLGGPASENGRLRHGDGTHGLSDRYRRCFVLPPLWIPGTCSPRVCRGAGCSISLREDARRRISGHKDIPWPRSRRRRARISGLIGT